MQGSEGVRGGGQGGSTELSGNFKGDMQVVVGYPRCEERGRLGVGPSQGSCPLRVSPTRGDEWSGWGKVKVGRGQEGSGGVVRVGPQN